MAASAPRLTACNPAQERRRQQGASAEWAAEQARRREERALGQQRGQVYLRRRQEDAAWRAACAERRARSQPIRGHQTHQERAARRGEEAQWRACWAERHALLECRRAEDEIWRQERRRFRAVHQPVVSQRTWIALLVVTDNYTRQCLGLPLFVAGPKITATLVIAALRTLLPADLQFLISDRGTQFTAHDFACFAAEHSVVPVLVGRHRPESTSSAERFVRTLKEWLAAQTWTDAAELDPLLVAFRQEDNARPHQGLALPGLSPDEFAGRIWLF